MSRAIRLVGKKRGGRNTGSERMGRVGFVAFSATFCGLGVILLGLIVRDLVVPEWRVNHSYLPVEGQVHGWRVERGQTPTRYRPRVQVSWKVGNATYTNWIFDADAVNDPEDGFHYDYAEAQQTAQMFADGAPRTVWYDPGQPNRAVLLRGYSLFPWLMLLLPVAFMSVGGGGLVIRLAGWNKSAEHRAMLHIEPGVVPMRRTVSPFPYVPDFTSVNDSPGTRLAIRLALAGTPLWRLTWLVLLAVAVAGVGGYFCVQAIANVWEGQGNVWQSIFAAVWMGVAGMLLYAMLRQMMLAISVGRTIVEVSAHPLRPGDSCRLHFRQNGRLTVSSLRVLIVCEEQATYRFGTDTRTERRRVYEHELFLREGFRVRRQAPLEFERELLLPESAMHSFHGERNEIDWAIVVEGEIEALGRFERRFPIIVYPVLRAVLAA